MAIPTLGRLLLFGFFWAYLLIVCVTALLSRTPGAHLVIPALALYLTVMLVPLARYRPEHGWFYPPIFMLLMVCVRLLRSFAMYSWGMPYHIALPDYDQHDLAALVAFELLLDSAGWLCYQLSFLAGPRLPIPRLSFGAPRRLALKAGAVILLAAGVCAVYLQLQGGVVSHILSWGESRHVAVSGEYYWVAAIKVGLYAALLWMALDRRALGNPVFYAATGVAVVAAFLTTGSRSSVIVPLLLGLLAWMLRARRVMLLRLLGAALIALVLLNILGNFRRSTWGGAIDWGALVRFEGGSSVSTAELVMRATNGNGTSPILARVPAEVDMLYGSSYLAVLAMPIPRGLWPGKPGGIDGQVGQTFFSSSGGVPPGPMGEAYWNFGLPGIMAAFSLFGLFQRWLAETYSRNGGHPALALPYVAALYVVEPSSSRAVDALMMFVPIAMLLVAFGAVRLTRSTGQMLPGGGCDNGPHPPLPWA